MTQNVPRVSEMLSEPLIKLMEIVQAQHDLADRGWAYFSTVSIAVVGFALTSDKLKASLALRVATVVGFAVFAVGNLRAVYMAQSNLSKYITLLNRMLAETKVDQVIDPLRPASLTWSCCSMRR